MEKIVKINKADSEAVERKFYEYNAGMATVKFLMKDKDVDRKLLQEYIDVNEKRYTELELLKEGMSKKYMPEELKDVDVDYTFIFETEEIRYEERRK